jgi:hypothetical protein
MTTTMLNDTRAGPWRTDQFKDFMIRTSCSGGSHDTLITGNSAHTIYSTFPSTSCRSYSVYRRVANSYKHFRRVSGISTTDLNLTALTVSVPHYFDTEDAQGRVHSFSPHTDQRDDQYSKRKDLGQYTLEIEAPADAKLHNFLNVVSLKDPGAAKSNVLAAPGEGAAGAVIGTTLVVFSAQRSMQTARVTVPKNGAFTAFICNLDPGRTYYLEVKGSSVEISPLNNGGRVLTPSPAGIAATTLAVNDTTAPAAPRRLRKL